MKNKNGFLLAEETLKLILAVIAIGFLAYLLFALYQNSQDSKNLELARESLGHVFEELNSEREEIEIYNPDGWHLSSWPNTYTSGFLIFKSLKSGKPLSCDNLGWESCICICDNNNPESCDDSNVCMENEGGFNFEEGVKIKNPPVVLQVDYETKEITRK